MDQKTKRNLCRLRRNLIVFNGDVEIFYKFSQLIDFNRVKYNSRLADSSLKQPVELSFHFGLREIIHLIKNAEVGRNG